MAGCQCGGPRTEVPTYRAPRATRLPVIDGRLDDEIWQRAAQTEPFVNTMDGSRGAPHSLARMAWDSSNFYVAFDVDDEFLHCTLTGHDAHLWEQDTVEIMVDPDSDGRNYFE